MVILSSDDEITLNDVPEEPALSRELRQRPPSEGPGVTDPGEGLSFPATTHEGTTRASLREYRELAERKYILETLAEFDWNISRAAAVLGIERTNLHKKMRALAIRREDATGG